jgi:hypothetical protein
MRNRGAEVCSPLSETISFSPVRATRIAIWPDGGGDLQCLKRHGAWKRI